ncbi:transcriptional regulation of mitochondrial recombination-domain-containing protein [Cladorrhinum sp. PSN259]|nr:transcriptional regulation of mitochondrial recombination-domain-containing protein [Cladorrhinum sp. PSN259]
MNSFGLNPARAAAASPAITTSLLTRFAALSASFSFSASCEKTWHHPPGVKRHENDKGHPTGHGEKIYIYNHIVGNHIIYSFTPDLRTNKALRQLDAYTGKKLVPDGLRKDYWRPMAVVEFARGNGHIGRSVYQKLRELRKRHELEWDNEELLNVSRHERGKMLNDQKGNAVADLAHVLAGNGKGNRVLKASLKKDVAEKEGEEKEGGEKEEGVLQKTTVYWASEQDRYFAREWTDNVTHVVGLPAREWIKKFGVPTISSGEVMKEEAGIKEEEVTEGEQKVPV